MNGKKTMYTEFAYILGLLTLAVGTAFMEKADFGMSMVVAPAYLVYLKLSQSWSWFTFGMAEYCFQALLLMVTSLALCKVKLSYLFSFVTAVIYGLLLDLCIWLTSGIPGSALPVRVALFLGGMVFCSVGVALLFHTYITPEAYELLVKEISASFDKDIHKVKTIYDCASCASAIVLSFLFFGFGHFEGVKLGTIFCALTNGWLIGQISHRLESVLSFRDALRK